MPYACIVVSSRESATFRNNIIKIAATKISAGVCTGIGGHIVEDEQKGDEQFEICDTRSFDEIYAAVKEAHMKSSPSAAAATAKPTPTSAWPLPRRRMLKASPSSKPAGPAIRATGKKAGTHRNKAASPRPTSCSRTSSSRLNGYSCARNSNTRARSSATSPLSTVLLSAPA